MRAYSNCYTTRWHLLLWLGLLAVPGLAHSLLWLVLAVTGLPDHSPGGQRVLFWKQRAEGENLWRELWNSSPFKPLGCGEKSSPTDFWGALQVSLLLSWCVWPHFIHADLFSKVTGCPPRWFFLYSFAGWPANLSNLFALFSFKFYILFLDGAFTPFFEKLKGNPGTT